VSQEWRLRAACAATDPFAGSEAEFVAEGWCSTCPVKADCLAADPRGEEQGVYGGLTRRERQARARRAKPDKRLAPCGTEAAYQRHYRWKEAACEPCKRAHSQAELERRARKVQRRPASQAPACGTARGYRQHQRRHEETCGPCRAAWNTYLAERRTVREAA
jgi:hypothetical protein